MARSRWSAVLLGFVMVGGACATTLGSGDDVAIEDEGGASADGDFEGDLPDDPPEDDKADGSGLVRDYLRTCSTSPTIGVSMQIIEEINCIAPGALVRLEESPDIEFKGAAVLPYFHPEAARALERAAEKRDLLMTSAFRTVIQQYMLRQWAGKRCRIPAAAKPGTSHHESGIAVDLSNYSSVVTIMKEQGWIRTELDVKDFYHFSHVKSPDIRGMGVLAFQRLWNENNPDDPISEDGEYGPQTGQRLLITPAAGFPIGSTCTAETPEDEDDDSWF